MQEDDTLSRMEERFHILHLGEKSLGLGKILSSDTSIKILETVYKSDSNVGVSASEISKELGVGRTTVLYHLGRMQKRGLVKVNPVLEHDEKWKKFWDLYRKKGLEVSKEQFNRLHDARMNGIKLYIPTKKGFLVMPSTDAKEGRTMAKEALASITAPAVEGGYRKMAKTASVFGILGLLFIAASMLLPGNPFFQTFGGQMEKTPMFMPEGASASPQALEGAAAPMASSPPRKSLMYEEGELKLSAADASSSENTSEYFSNQSVVASVND
jgi:DNA-binding transcriptional ArsR family regulator